jgi:tRNA1(Val) A37 N6-methylase TrmN6
LRQRFLPALLAGKPAVDADLLPDSRETLDCILGGNIQMLQAKSGYRTAIDAPLLAWFAAQQVPHARLALELGAGSGLVAIVLARALPAVHVHMLETQPQLADRARRNARLNHVASRLHVVQGDVAAPPVLAGPFDVVLCNPPYLQRDRAQPPAQAERRIAHQESTATLAQFCQLAAAQLTADSPSCWVFPFHAAQRLLDDLASAGLGRRTVMRVLHRPGDAKPIRVLVAARAGPPDLQMLADRALHVPDQPDRVFQPDLAEFFANLAASEGH